jgi:2-hydroxychromene-2-carboxylate isomerase
MGRKSRLPRILGVIRLSVTSVALFWQAGAVPFGGVSLRLAAIDFERPADMSETLIDFYWEPSSPYSYIASMRIEAVAQRLAAGVSWKPILLGKVFEATGNRMNVAVAVKGRYMYEDLDLLAKWYQLALTPPKVFPTNSVAVARAALAAPAEHQPALSKALMRAYWGEGRDLTQADEVRKVIVSAGLDADAVLARTQETSVKDQLRQNTEEAIARGVFGAPSFYAKGKLFWGSDRIELMEAWLGGKLAG